MDKTKGNKGVENNYSEDESSRECSIGSTGYTVTRHPTTDLFQKQNCTQESTSFHTPDLNKRRKTTVSPIHHPMGYAKLSNI